MENLLQGIAGFIVYLDDIVITVATETDHLVGYSRIELRVKKHNCQIMASSVSYLRHLIDSAGLHPL